MQKHTEKLNILNEKGEIIGEASRDEIHEKGLLHGEVNVWLLAEKGIVFQHRSKDKDTFPDLFDATAGGHVDLRENFEISAIKELEEETGIKANLDDLVFIKNKKLKFFDKKTNKINNIIKTIYVYKNLVKLEDLKIENGKALGFKEFSLEEIKKLKEDNIENIIIPELLSDEQIEIYEKCLEMLKV